MQINDPSISIPRDNAVVEGYSNELCPSVRPIVAVNFDDYIFFIC